MSTINGASTAPVKVSRVGNTLDHGYAWCVTTATGQFIVVPLRNVSARKLREVFFLDEIYNGPPHWRERVRRWGWLVRAVILRKQDA